jgi:signal transduction histidine kinase
MVKAKRLKFEPGARAIIQMGEELIGHPTTAINELVKNGYDADATKVEVYIHFSKESAKRFLIIADNGLGMDSGTLFGPWLQPSVSGKRIGAGKSKVFERNFLGSKGIGRLAAMALGDYLTVITKTSAETEYNWLTLSKEKFKQESLLSNVEFPGGTSKSIESIFKSDEVLKEKNNNYNSEITNWIKNKNKSSFIEGTIVLIENLDDTIIKILSNEFLNGNITLENMTFIRALKILVTPLYLNPRIQDELITKKILDRQYQVSLSESVFDLYFGCNLIPADKYENSELKIEEYSVISNYDYRIIGKVTSDGAVKGSYYCNRLIEDSFESKFEILPIDVFSEESDRVRRLDGVTNNDFADPKVGDFFFDMRIFDRDPDAMDKLSTILKTSGRRETGAVLDQIVGLRISKNGFSIKPYGEEEKDWMGLGQMRVQNPTEIIGTNQLIGNIFLFSPKNDALMEKTNREGFFENSAFINFKKILRAILIQSGKKRYNYREKHSIGRKISSKNTRPDTTRFLDFIKTITSDPKAIVEAESYLESITTTLDNLENSLTFSQRLATLGSGLELVYHELAQPISIIGKCLFSMRFPIGQISDLKVRNELIAECSQIRKTNETLNTLKESLEPAIGKSRKVAFKPADTFNKVIYLLAKDILENSINVDIDEKLLNYQIKDYEYNLWIAFLNILNNAVYWLRYETENQRTVKFTLGSDDELIILNSGPKIEDAELENIFNYGVSHKKEKIATGLGLAFTRSLLSSNGWEIWAENYNEGPAFIMKPNK